MLRRVLSSRLLPVSLLGKLSYVSVSQECDSYEASRRPCAKGTVTTAITRFTVGRGRKTVIPGVVSERVRPDYSAKRNKREQKVAHTDARRYSPFSSTPGPWPPECVINNRKSTSPQGLKRCVLGRKASLKALCDGEY